MNNKDTKSRIGFGLAGTGMIAPYHIRSINKNRHARLLGVFSNSHQRGKEFAYRYGIKHYARYVDMLNDTDIDAVDIITYNYLHGDFAIKALECNKHVVIEKPMTIDIEEAEKLLELAQKQHRRVSCVSQYRFAPGIRELKELMGKGTIKNIHTINVSIILKRERNYFTESPWKANPETSGGGILIMNAIHVIDILLMLFGPPEEVACKKILSRDYSDVEDRAALLLTFKNNVVCTISATNNACKELAIAMQVHGETGSIFMEDFVITRVVGLRKRYFPFTTGHALRCLMQKKNLLQRCFDRQIKDSIDAIREDREPISSAAAGLTALATIKMIYDACA